MTFPKSRLIQCATVALAFFGARSSGGQSTLLLTTPAQLMEFASALPDSPSFSTSNPQTPAQTPAQTQTPAPAQPPPNETPEQRKAREHAEAERQVQEQEKQRIGGIIPNFNVRMGGPFVPLSPKEKWSLSLHTIIDPYTIGLAAFVGGGYGGFTDDHTGYGHGTAGYFKRTAASYADNVDGNLIGNALLPIILHQDPRYFRKGEGSIKSRVFYSAMTTFICRGDNGKKQFNVSNVLGNFISGAISNAYYPDDEKGVSLTINNATVVTLEGMIGAQLLEFSPDVTAYIHRRREHHRMLLQEKLDAAKPPPVPVIVQPAAPPPPPTTPPQP